MPRSMELNPSVPHSWSALLNELLATAWQRLERASATRGSRFRAYTVIALGFGVLAVFTVSFKPDFDFIVSDGRSYYAYLTSVVIDGDLDFSNQILEHWGPKFKPRYLEDLTPVGRVRNKYPIGMALTLAPAFLSAHGVSWALHRATGLPLFRPDGYTVLYQLLGLAWILGLGLVTMLLIDRWLEERYALRPSSVFLGVAGCWVGTHYAYYYFREPFMVHALSTFWVVACVFSLHRLVDGEGRESPDLRFVAFASLSLGMALVCRPSNAFLCTLFVLAAWSLWRQRSRLRAFPTVAALLAGLVPVAIQAGVWRRLFGSFVHYSYETEGFNWMAPRLWQTLFSSRQGLFFWAPLLLLSALGLAARTGAGRVDRFAGALGAGAVVLWYVNSSWHMWNFGDAFGARAFLEATPLFALGLAGYYENAADAPPERRGVLRMASLPLIAWTWLLMVAYVVHWVPRSDYLF